VEAAPFGHLLASRPPRSRGGTLAASLVSAAGHLAAVAGLLYATGAMANEEVPEPEPQVMLIEVPAPIVLPPPPPPAGQPELVTPDVVKGFQTLTAPDLVPTVLPPPAQSNTWKAEDFTGVGIKGGRGEGRELKPGEEVNTISPSDAPRFVPMTQRPQLLNQPEVVRALERSYPTILREAGIGGKVGVWFFIDEQGKVLKTQLQEPSEHDAFNKAALEVAGVMKFSPAMNRDKHVPVWVAIPIVFSTR
jgi:TonB family protein